MIPRPRRLWKDDAGNVASPVLRGRTIIRPHAANGEGQNEMSKRQCLWSPRRSSPRNGRIALRKLIVSRKWILGLLKRERTLADGECSARLKKSLWRTIFLLTGSATSRPKFVKKLHGDAVCFHQKTPAVKEEVSVNGGTGKQRGRCPPPFHDTGGRSRAKRGAIKTNVFGYPIRRVYALRRAPTQAVRILYSTRPYPFRLINAFLGK